MLNFYFSKLPLKIVIMFFTLYLNDSDLFERLIESPESMHNKVKSLMQDPFPFVKHDTGIEEISRMINRKNQAVLMTDLGGVTHIITKYDVIDAVGD